MQHILYKTSTGVVGIDQFWVRGVFDKKLYDTRRSLPVCVSMCTPQYKYPNTRVLCIYVQFITHVTLKVYLNMVKNDTVTVLH